jgi:hypothetical protein
VKHLDWEAVRAQTPGKVDCPHCGRPGIVVDKRTGLRTPHYTTPQTGAGRRRDRAWCDGGNRKYDSQPPATT